MASLLFYYLRWHYSIAIRDMVGIIRNFVWFFYEFFSIPLLLQTFFVPFHRLAEKRTQGFHPEAWAEAFVVNTLMRGVGMGLRAFLIVLGVTCILMTVCIGIGMFMTWIMAPLLLTFLVGSAVTLITVG